MNRTAPALLALAAVALLLAPPLLAGPPLKGNFQRVTAETDENLFQVKLFPSGRAYACGTDGVVVRSNDKGGTWDWSQIAEDIEIRVMHWTDLERGFFCARFRLVDRFYKTTDGAKTFKRFQCELPYWAQGIAFADRNVGWIVCGSSKEQDGDWRVTTNGGTTWKKPASEEYFIPGRPLFAITTVGDGHLFAVGGHVERRMVGDAARCKLYQQKEGAVLHSADKGATWEVLHAGNPVGVYLRAVSFTSPLHGWVAGDKGFVARTADGGKTWKVLKSGTEERLLAISAVNGKTAFATGYRGTAIATRDEGETWTALDSGTKVHLRDCSFIDENTGFTVGKNGKMLRFARLF